MTKQWPAIADGRAGLVMFARGDRVFPVDDLGGGVWSRRGTVLSVHPLSWEEMQPSSGGVRVDATPAATSGCARATVLWDDGSAEVLAEDKLCLVYDQEAPVGIRVVTMPMNQPCDVVDHSGQVVLVLREGLLPPEAVIALRAGLGRVRAALTPGHTDAASAAEQRRRDLGLLNALIAEMTATGVATGVAPVAAVLRPDVMVGGPGDGAATGPQVHPDPGGRPDVFVGRPDMDIEDMVAGPLGRATANPGTGPLPGSGPQARPRR